MTHRLVRLHVASLCLTALAGVPQLASAQATCDRACLTGIADA